MSGLIGVSPRSGESRSPHRARRTVSCDLLHVNHTFGLLLPRVVSRQLLWHRHHLINARKTQGSYTGTGTRHRALARAWVTGTGTGHRHGHGHGYGHGQVITLFSNHFKPFQSFQIVTFLGVTQYFQPWFSTYFIFVSVFVGLFTNYQAGFHGDYVKFCANFCIISTILSHNFLPFSNYAQFSSLFVQFSVGCRITPTFSNNSNLPYLSSQSLTKLCGYIFEVLCSIFFCFSVPILIFENCISNLFQHSHRSTVFCKLVRNFSCVSKTPVLYFDHSHKFQPMVYDPPSTFNNCFARLLANCPDIFGLFFNNFRPRVFTYFQWLSAPFFFAFSQLFHSVGGDFS